jgi:methanogenic corrinoid protein MtbC1/anti-sigma regulatory factor (Ser/Thr protein kinase)
VAAGFPQRDIPVHGELTHRGILSDRRRLGQVVRGLIANALRYGGPQVWVELRELEDRAVVEVHDNGSGLSPEDRERVFEPFQSGEAGLGVGTGVGLAVARALVNDMGGLLEYREGRPGAVFAVTLPLVGAVPRPIALELEAEREALLAELVSYRPEAARRRLNRLSFSLPSDQVIRLVLAPVMWEVGDRWQRAEITVTQEHHASSLVLGWLVGQLARFEPTTSTTVVCATAPGSHHELGIASVAVALAQHGFRTLYLGGSAPVPSLVQTVTETGARALLLSATMAGDLHGIVEVGEALQEAGLGHVLLGFGGRAFAEGRSPEGLPGQFLGTDPAQAVELLEAHTTACLV